MSAFVTTRNQSYAVREVTPADRFAARDLLADCRRNGHRHLSEIVDAAIYTESFPISYTPEAQAAARRLLVENNSAEVTGRGDRVLQAIWAVDRLRAAGEWYL
jgi:hypothetical protein